MQLTVLNRIAVDGNRTAKSQESSHRKWTLRLLPKMHGGRSPSILYCFNSEVFTRSSSFTVEENRARCQAGGRRAAQLESPPLIVATLSVCLSVSR